MSDSAPRRERGKNPILHPTPAQVAPSAAGRKFALSSSWHQDYVQAQLAARRRPLDDPQALLAAVRAADDPDRPWPALGLLNALGLPPRPLHVLQHRLEHTETTEITLRELMDAVMLGEGATTVSRRTSGILVLPGMGVQAFTDTAKTLTTLDLGPRCNALWYERVASLKGRWASIPAARPRPATQSKKPA
jgi:hypothetical protein